MIARPRALIISTSKQQSPVSAKAPHKNKQKPQTDVASDGIIFTINFSKAKRG